MTAGRTTTGFIELPENRLARTAALRLARSLRTRSSFPLVVLHGPAGVGKSLLVKDLVDRVVRGPAVRTVRVLPANELAFTVDADVTDKDLLTADLLVIEDVQHLSTAAITRFTQLLDDRARRRRATLLTANAGPGKLKLPPRLASRLGGGLVVALEPYSVASRKALLKALFQAANTDVDTAALDTLATRIVGGSARPLAGAVETLKSVKQTITVESVNAIFDAPPVGVETIVRHVANAYGVKVKELLGPSRLRTVLLPRQVAMFLAREVAALSLPRIGAHFGGRDHSTVQHAVNKIRTALAGDRQLAGTIRQLKMELV